MADAKALPVFAFTDERIQVQQLRGYLKQHGASIEEEGPADFSENLLGLVKELGIVGRLESDKETEMILSSVSSLVVAVTPESAVKIVDELCKQLSSDSFQGLGWSSNVGAAVRILSNLFHGFNIFPRVQYALFVALVKLCGRARIIGDLNVSLEQVNEYIKKWSLNKEQHRNLLRDIHVALINDQKADQAAKAMMALLGTYTDEDAQSAVDDAHECVRTAIVDPKSFSFDHLLRLEAVRVLGKKDPVMFEVLKLFSEGTLKDYHDFVQKHPNFVKEKLHVDESVLVKKMRLLTLMTMAEKNNVILLKDLAREVAMEDGEELEEFIIEAIQVNAITGKVDEIRRELHITSMQHRSFGRPQWELLQKRLIMLIDNLKEAHRNIGSVIPEEDSS